MCHKDEHNRLKERIYTQLIHANISVVLDFLYCHLVIVGLKQRNSGDAALDGPVAPPRVQQGTWVADRAGSCRTESAAQVLLEQKSSSIVDSPQL